MGPTFPEGTSNSTTANMYLVAAHCLIGFWAATRFYAQFLAREKKNLDKTIKSPRRFDLSAEPNVPAYCLLFIVDKGPLKILRKSRYTRTNFQ